MVLAFILVAVVNWFIFKHIWFAIIIFYIVIGIRKTIIWLSLPDVYVPYFLKNRSLGSFFLNIFIWPIIIISNGHDPANEYIRDNKSIN